MTPIDLNEHLYGFEGPIDRSAGEPDPGPCRLADAGVAHPPHYRPALFGHYPNGEPATYVCVGVTRGEALDASYARLNRKDHP